MRQRESSQPPDGSVGDPKRNEHRDDEVEGRKAQRSDHYATDGRTGTAEGNDPSLTAGKTTTRKVPSKPG